MYVHIYEGTRCPCNDMSKSCIKNPSLEETMVELSLLEAWGKADGVTAPQVGTKYKSWRKLGQQNHAQSLQEAIITFFFFSVLTLCCIIPHESSCQGDANFQ